MFNSGWYISLVCDKATITSNTDGVVCNGETVILTANEGVSYLWSTGETTQSIAVTTPGYYSVQVLTSENCNFVSDPYFVEFAAVQAPTITPNGTITVCPGESVNLISSQGVSYEWSNGSTSQSTNVVEAGQYWVSVTDANSCVAVSEIVTIENHVTSPIDITPSGNISICYGDSVQISTTASDDILWSTGATTQSIYVSEVGTYNVSAPDASGCMSISNNLNISFYNPEPPTITPSEPQTICEGNSTLLSCSSGIAYNWNTGASTQSISVQEAGNYWVVVTDVNNCSRASAPVSINVNPNPPTPTITETEGLLQSSITGGYAFQWYYNGEAIAGATNSFYMATQNGLYFVELTDNFGCSTLSLPYNLQGVGIEDNSLSNSVKLYPNPFVNKSTLVINSPKATTITIDCMDMLGRKIANIYQGDIPSENFQIEINAQALGLASGNYLLNISSNEEVMQYKISISK